MPKGEEGYDNMASLVAAALAVHLTDVNVKKVSGTVVEALIAEAGGEDHVLHVDGWNDFYLAHPITERFKDEPLGNCLTFQHFIRAYDFVPPEPGKYRLILNEDGIPTDYLRIGD